MTSWQGILYAIMVTALLAGCGRFDDVKIKIEPFPQRVATVEPFFPTAQECPQGRYNVALAPTAWRFRFRDEAQNLEELGLRTDNIRHCHQRTRELTWDTHGEFVDEDPSDPFKDPYKWGFNYTIAEMHDSFMRYGNKGYRSEDPSEQPNRTFTDSFISEELKCYDAVTVVLRGWRLRFLNGDHHLRRAQIRISNVQYNWETGKVSWDVRARLADKNNDDPYEWKYQWLIIGCRDCQIKAAHETQTFGFLNTWQVQVPETRWSRETSDEESEADEVPKTSSATFFQGWKFRYDNLTDSEKDTKVRELGMSLAPGALNEPIQTVHIGAFVDPLGNPYDPAWLVRADVVRIIYPGAYLSSQWFYHDPDRPETTDIDTFLSDGAGRKTRHNLMAYTKSTSCSAAQDHTPPLPDPGDVLPFIGRTDLPQCPTLACLSANRSAMGQK